MRYSFYVSCIYSAYRNGYNGGDLKSLVSINWPVGSNPTAEAMEETMIKNIKSVSIVGMTTYERHNSLWRCKNVVGMDGKFH